MSELTTYFVFAYTEIDGYKIVIECEALGLSVEANSPRIAMELMLDAIERRFNPDLS